MENFVCVIHFKIINPILTKENHAVQQFYMLVCSRPLLWCSVLFKIYFAVLIGFLLVGGVWCVPARSPELCPLTVTDVICRSGEQPSTEAQADATV